MRSLTFSYAMRLDFGQPVRRHAFQLRCLPRERAGQRVLSESFRIEPGVPVSAGLDGFQNRLLYGMAEEPHSSFSFETSGRVGLSGAPQPDTPLNAARYLHETPFTRPGPALRALNDSVQPGSPDSAALSLMRAVHSAIAYRPTSTGPDTTAEQAALQGCGVCQDHAQILLSLLRMRRIPCRYVSGLTIGEGSTHAWVEAYLGGVWIGLDPTNDRVVRDEHIAFCVGRDHSDCEMNRGVLYGSGEQRQTIRVTVSEASEREESECR